MREIINKMREEDESLASIIKFV